MLYRLFDCTSDISISVLDDGKTSAELNVASTTIPLVENKTEVNKCVLSLAELITFETLQNLPVQFSRHNLLPVLFSHKNRILRLRTSLQYTVQFLPK